MLVRYSMYVVKGVGTLKDPGSSRVLNALPCLNYSISIHQKWEKIFLSGYYKKNFFIFYFLFNLSLFLWYLFSSIISWHHITANAFATTSLFY